MADLSPNLPLAEPGDAADVALALETARALWLKRQGLEAVRWIQRAAESAEAAGDDLRALALARAAADLRAEVSMSSEPPGSINEGMALVPYDDFSEQTIVDSPATSMARQALQSGVQIAEVAHAPPPSPVVLVPSLRSAPSLERRPPSRHETVRVAVLRADKPGRLLTVRVLGVGEPAPPGTAEALLVSLDTATKLLE